MAIGPNLSFTIWYGLTVHIICFKITSKILFIFLFALKLQAKFSKLSPPVKIPANYAKSMQFAHTVREFRRIRTFG